MPSIAVIVNGKHDGHLIKSGTVAANRVDEDLAHIKAHLHFPRPHRAAVAHR